MGTKADLKNYRARQAGRDLKDGIGAISDSGKDHARRHAGNASRVFSNNMSRMSANPGSFFDDILGGGELKQGWESVKGEWDKFNDIRKNAPFSDAQKKNFMASPAGKAGKAMPTARGAWGAANDVWDGHNLGNSIENGFNWLTAAEGGHTGWARAGRGLARGAAAYGALKVADWLNPFSD